MNNLFWSLHTNRLSVESQPNFFLPLKLSAVEFFKASFLLSFVSWSSHNAGNHLFHHHHRVCITWIIICANAVEIKVNILTTKWLMRTTKFYCTQNVWCVCTKHVSADEFSKLGFCLSSQCYLSLCSLIGNAFVLCKRYQQLKAEKKIACYVFDEMRLNCLSRGNFLAAHKFTTLCNAKSYTGRRCRQKRSILCREKPIDAKGTATHKTR